LLPSKGSVVAMTMQPNKQVQIGSATFHEGSYLEGSKGFKCD
jgi:hypothetical protein